MRWCSEWLVNMDVAVPQSPVDWVLPWMQTYLLKLARSGEDGEKIYLVLESGTRFHTTKVHAYLKCRPVLSPPAFQIR